MDTHSQSGMDSANDPAQGLRASPVFIVRDVLAAAEYYRTKLGFGDLDFYGNPECFCTMRLGNIMLMLSQPDEACELQPNFRLNDYSIDAHFLVDDAQRQHAFCVAQGADIAVPLREAPYGMLEFIVRDLDGYGILIGQNL